MDHPEGRFRFGLVDAQRLRAAITGCLCSICDQLLEERIVLAMRDSDLRRSMSSEPGMHPECAHYSVAACPILAGRMARYSGASGQVAAELGISLGDPRGLRAGHRAQVWRLVWVRGYEPVTDPATGLPAALISPRQVLRTRPIT